MSDLVQFETPAVRWLRYGVIAAFTLTMMFPIIWIFVSSIKPTGQLFSSPPELLPRAVSFEHYQVLLSGENLFFQFFLNSAVVAVSTTVTTVAIAVVAGYGWAQFDFFGARSTSLFVLVSRIFPVVVLMVPMFELLRQFGLLNSHLGLVVSYQVFTLPLSIWMLKGFFESIPDNVLRAGRIDGLSEFQIFREIALPLVKPGVAATALYAFIIAWQEFIFALIFIRDEQLKTLPIGLLGYIGKYEISWGMLMAASFVTVLPVAVVFMFLQKYFIRGLASGATKG
jgi:ABC-type glycerol-3-phosphate transport system permease component